MYAAERLRRLNDVSWAAENEENLYFVEGGHDSNSKFEHGRLEGRNLDGWLQRLNTSASTNNQTYTSATSQRKRGGFRLILCEQSAYSPPTPNITRENFLRIESTFTLHSTTIPSLFSSSGVFSRHIEYYPGTREASILRLVVKAKHKSGIGNWNLSLRHSYATGWTDAFVCGAEIVVASDKDKKSSQFGIQLEQIIEMLESCQDSWSHPVLLPAVLLRVYCSRSKARRYELADQLVDLESDIGVTFAGRSGGKRSLKNWPEDIDIKAVTIGLHSTGAQIFYLSQVCSYAKELAVFLIKLCDDVVQGHKELWHPSEELKDVLEHELNAMVWIGHSMQTKKDRIQSQLNVLYSAASQKENAIAINYSRMAQEANEISLKDMALNTKIASSTKRDSIAMMTVTCITALLLPGTYMSSLFSMDMFDWMAADSSTNRQEVSSRFWIYWAITIPLTLSVMLGWFLWYRTADRAWQRETGFHLSGALWEASSGEDVNDLEPHKRPPSNAHKRTTIRGHALFR